MFTRTVLLVLPIALALGACTPQPPDDEAPAATTAAVVDAAVVDGDPCSRKST